MKKLDVFRVLLQISWRNLRSHASKTLIVGSIMFFGTMLWTLGSSMVGSVERAMSKTIIDSVSGHLQIYEDETRDTLALYGGTTFGAVDIGQISSFSALTAAVGQVENVKSIIPMGTTFALLANPSRLDNALADLRSAVRANDQAGIERESERARYLLDYLSSDTEARAKGQMLTEEINQNIANLRYATAATFWADFASAPLDKLEFLDTQIAPLGSDAAMIYLSLLGTDLDRYRQEFSNFELLSGEPVPQGERGLLMPERFLEQIKNIVARELDDMHKKVSAGETFVESEALRDQATRNVRQYKRVLVDLHPAKQETVRAALAQELGKDGTLAELMQAYLQVDDTNFERRYALFKEVIAPNADLYPVKVGEQVTMRAFTRSGYMRAVNIKLYGIYGFKGMEEADLAGSFSIIDLMTFRELFGAPSAAQKAELSALKASIGIEEVSRDNAEDALFGGGDALAEAAEAPKAVVALEPVIAEEAATGSFQGFTQRDIDDGLALHAAVRLKDPSRMAETQQQLRDALKASGQKMRVVTWQEAAGFVGQMTLAMRAVLLFGMFVIFLVALVVVNNTVVISTMERTNEIGTLRAIGAQRGFILMMFLLEMAAIAVVAGLAGALSGAGIVNLLGAQGVPAFTKEVNFLFGGPVLYPTVSAADMISGLIIILLVSIAATYFPARAATRVQPVEAMRDTN